VRKLVIDFDITVLWPLIVVSLILLVSSLRSYWKANRHWKMAVNRLRGSFDTREEGEEILEWRGTSRRDKDRSQSLIAYSLAGVLIPSLVMLIGDKWKLEVGYFVWGGLLLSSAVSFLIAMGMTWHYAKKSDWPRLGLCLFAMLIAAASSEHFFHQHFNAHRVTCPQCDDDDDSRPDDY